MKKLLIPLTIYILFVALVSIYACGKGANTSTCMDRKFGGTHKLRKFNIYTETGTYSHGSFFLLGGSYSSGTRTTEKVKFSWLNGEDSSYVLSEIEPNRIRVHLDSTITEPYVTFGYDDDKCSCHDNMHYYFEWGDINYITVFCKEEDYPLNINIKDL